MAHAHSHEDSDSYYPEQLCLIAFSGLFGGICLSMYFWQKPMLNLLLAEYLDFGPFKVSFHLCVLLSGIALIALTLVRAAVLWKTAGETAPQPHAHHHTHQHGEHEHAHDCGHEHVHGPDCANHVHHQHEHDCGHDHDHADHGHHEHGADCGHEHAHAHDCSHAHTHTHAAGHGHDHHEHGWAPWRYMILLTPIILFLLGLPNKQPAVEASNFKVGASREENAGYAALVGAGSNPWSQVVTLLGVSADATAGKDVKIDFKTLEQAAVADREQWNGKVVRVVGQYRPNVQSQREFSLMRLLIKCCGNDAIPLDVPIICKEPVTSIQPMQWIEVTGRVEFQKRPGSNDSYMTILRVPNRKKITPTEPDSNPYIQ